MLSKEELNQIERCKEFIQEKEGKRREYLLVHISDVHDMDTSQIVPIGKIDTILRMNGYRGILILDGREDNYFIIDVVKKEMINLPGEIEKFVNRSIGGRVIDFYDFIKIHIRTHGLFRNSITVTSKEGCETTTIELYKRRSWNEFVGSKEHHTGNYLLVYIDQNIPSSNVFKSLKERGYSCAGRAVENVPWFNISLNTKLWFSGKIGVDLLSGDEVVGNHAITLNEFYLIDDIFKKYEGHNLLSF